MQLFKQEQLGLTVGMWHVKLLYLSLFLKDIKVIKQHEMVVILIEKNLGTAKMLAVCRYLVGLPSACTLVYTP